MQWKIKFLERCADFYAGLEDEQKEAINERLVMLRERGPQLGEPIVKRIETSRYQNMKELRVSKDGNLRLLFIFDPERRAVFLLGGDKTGEWNKWYKTAVPQADALYEQYLREGEDGTNQ